MQQLVALKPANSVAKLPLIGAYNLSGVEFDEATLAVLNCGLKFIPTPACRSVSGASGEAVDSFSRNVRLRIQFQDAADKPYNPQFYVPNPVYQPHAAPPDVEDFLVDIRNAVTLAYRAARSLPARNMPNLTAPQHAALSALRANRQIVIKPADKNLGMVILDKCDYEAMLLSVLNDVRHFSVVATPMVDNLRSQLHTLVYRWRYVMGAEMFKFVLTSSNRSYVMPQPYAMPKIHKLPTVDSSLLPQLKARVIVPCHSWVTTGASQFLAFVLNQACAQRFPQVLPDSRTMIRQLDGVQVARNSILVSFDVVDMYPSIDIDAAATSCAAAVPAPLRMMVHQFLQFVLHNMYCQRNGVVYQQTSGVTMGTACAPPVANIYMATAFEHTAKQRAVLWPQHYFRLIDDGFFIWEYGPRTLQAFMRLLSTLLPNIQLTFQQHDTKLCFLDLWIEKDMSYGGDSVPLVFTTYQKAHNKYLYIPFQSHHRSHVFRAFIRGELIRYAVTNSRLRGFQQQVELFYQRLVARGYPTKLLGSIFASVAHADRQHYLQQPQQSHTPPRAGPVFVTVNDQHAHSRMNLSRVLNDVYHKYQHVPELHDMFGDRVVVAYSNPPSLGKLLVKASH